MATRKELLEELNNEIGRLSRTVGDGFDRFIEPIEVRSEDFVTSHEEVTTALERMAETHETSAEALSSSIDASLERHGQMQWQAAETISKSIDKAVDDIFTGALVGGFVWLLGKGIAASVDRVRKINKKTDMIHSIQDLQKKYPSLSYDFIVVRAYVKETNVEERQNILNELIHEGLVTVNNSLAKETVYIEPNNPKLLEYWKWLDSIKDEITKSAT